MDKKIEAIRKKGRNGDTILAHISPEEALSLTLNGGAGTRNPKTGLPEFFGWDDLNPFSGGGGGVLGSILTGGLSDAKAGYDEWKEPGGSFWGGLDRAIDPGGVADKAIRTLGDTAFGEAISPIVDVAGPIVGGVVGGIYGGPAGAAGGAAAGSGFAGKWKGEDESDIGPKAAVTGAASGALSYGGQLLSGATGNVPAGESVWETGTEMAAMPDAGAVAPAGGSTAPNMAALDAALANPSTGTAPTSNSDLATAIQAFQSGDEATAMAAMNKAAEMGSTAGGAVGANIGANVVGPGDGVSSTYDPTKIGNLETIHDGMNTPSSGQIPSGAEVVPGAPEGGKTAMWEDALKWVGDNKLKTAGLALMANNVLGSFNKADMAGDLNAAQQDSYSKWLSTINPPQDVKQTRYNALAKDTRTQSALATKKLNESLAQRGVRGRGTVAPTGDAQEAERSALNNAYNTIFGQYNTPSTPGPVNYSASAGNYAAGDTSQTINQMIPLMLMMSKYGAT